MLILLSTDLNAILFADKKPEMLLNYLKKDLTNGQPKINFLTLEESYNALIGNGLKKCENREKYVYSRIIVFCGCFQEYLAFVDSIHLIFIFKRKLV